MQCSRDEVEEDTAQPGSGFHKPSVASQRRRAFKYTRNYWDKTAQQLAPGAATYTLYRRTEGWLGVAIDPHNTENQAEEAVEHLHSHVSHVTRHCWPSSTIVLFKSKKGSKHIGTQYYELYPGGTTD